MSDKKVNLEEIFEEYRQKYLKEGMSFIDYNIKAMKEACRQVLELAAENVGFVETTLNELNSKDYMPFITADDNTIWTFNKQSILDTIKQVE